MAPSLLDTFRILSSFDPPRGSLKGAPWEEYVDWAIAQGLAPLAAYNLEYRLGGGGRAGVGADRLLSIYQGSVNDNVMKLVNFKRSWTSWRAASCCCWAPPPSPRPSTPTWASGRCWTSRCCSKRVDVEGFSGYLCQHEFRPEKDERQRRDARAVRRAHRHLPLRGRARRRAARGAAGHLRARPALEGLRPVHLPAGLEDAVLLLCPGPRAARATRCRCCPSWTCASSSPAPRPWAACYSRPLDVAVLQERAQAWRLERALYTSLSIIARLFPETAERRGAGPARRCAAPPGSC